MDGAKLERAGCRMQVEPNELEQGIEHNSWVERLAAPMRDADAMRQLHQLASRFARVSADSPIAHELVTDVIEDMLTGDASSDPARDVLPQIAGHVIERATRRWKGKELPPSDDERPDSKAQDRRYRSLPVWVPLEEAPPEALICDTLAPPSDEDGHPDIDPAELVDRIRQLAKDDEPAQQLLALHERAAKGRKRLPRRHALQAGMTPWSYRAARARLVAYAAAATSAVIAATSATAAASDGGDAPGAPTLPITRAIGLERRTARVRRTVSRAGGQTLRAHSAANTRSRGRDDSELAREIPRAR